MADRLDEATFYASLPLRRLAAGVLYRDNASRVLLVEPTYKPEWDIPGGFIEAGESPLVAARREIREELGSDFPIGSLWLVDWVPPEGLAPDGFIFIFNGGVLDDSDISNIVLEVGELASFAFVEEDRLDTLLTPLLAARIRACLSAPEHALVYLEGAEIPGTTSPSPRTSRLVQR